MRRAVIAGLGAALLMAPLAACGSGAEQGEAAKAAASVDGTLASAIAGAPGLTTVAAGLKATGLASVFDGTAPYTLLAPDDDAFGALGEAGKALQSPENGAAMAEILRDHILPGYLTVADIDAALKAANGKPVKMQTMGKHEVVFAREGNAVVVTAPDGASAKIDGAALSATNGVAIPLDAVLRKLPGSATAS